MKAMFGDDPASASMKNGATDWWTKAFPRFGVANGQHVWLTKSRFVGDLLPPDKPKHVKIEIYEIL